MRTESAQEDFWHSQKPLWDPLRASAELCGSLYGLPQPFKNSDITQNLYEVLYGHPVMLAPSHYEWLFNGCSVAINGSYVWKEFNVYSMAIIDSMVNGYSKAIMAHFFRLWGITGSSTVYGSSTEQWDGPIPEDAPLQPVSPYGVSKASTELLVLAHC